MRLVLDAAALVDLLTRSAAGTHVRAALARHPAAALLTAAHLDAEVLSALARLQRAGDLRADEVGPLLERLASLPMQRLPITRDLLAAAWEMRDNVATRGALYVAATRRLDARLVTTDQRLARACPDVALQLG